MIAWISAGFLVFGCVVLIRLFRLVEMSRHVTGIARESFEVIRNADQNDEAKEAALQQAAKHLLYLSIKLCFGGAAAVLLPLGLIVACDRLGWTSLDRAVEVALSPGFLISSTALALLACCVPRTKLPA